MHPAGEGFDHRNGARVYGEVVELAIFNVMADAAPTQNLTVCVTVAEAGSSRVASGSRGLQTVTIQSGSTTAEHILGWTDTAADDANSLVTVTAVAPGGACTHAGYTVSPTAGNEQILIEDDDATLVTLASTDSSMTEGDATATASATVTLSRRLFAGEVIEVPLSLTTTTGARLPGTATPDFAVTASGNGITTVDLDTVAPTLIFTGHDADTVQTATVVFTPVANRNDGDAADEAISVALASDSVLGGGGSATNVGGRAGRGASHTLTLTMVEPPATPEITITPDTSPVTEGANAAFTVNATPAPTANLTVDLNVADALNSNFVATGAEGSQTVTIMANATSAPYTVATTADTTDEPDGTVTVTVAGGSGYTVGTPSSAGVTVNDDDPTVVSLARTGTGAVTEGGTVEFTVTLSRALVAGEAVDAPLSISGAGVTPADWSLALKAGGSLNTGVSLSRQATATPQVGFSEAGAQTATLTLTAAADGAAEAGGETYAIALGPDGGGANGFDRAALSTNVGGGADPHATANSFNVTVNDPAAPVAAFDAGSSAAAEGAGTRNVRVILSPPPTANITLTYDVGGTAAENTDFSIAGSGSVTVSANAGSADIPVAIADDSAVEADETVILILTGSSDYTVGDPSVHTLTINDDDEPAVTVTADAASVTEGGTATFTLTASPAPAAAVTVGYTVTQAGNFAAGGQTGARTVAIGTGGTARVTVATVDDDADEPDGGVTVTVNGGSGYTVGDPSSATAAVSDDDATPPVLPAVSIELLFPGPWLEGSWPRFAIHFRPAPTAELTVNLRVDDAPGSDFLADSREGVQTLTAPVDDDLVIHFLDLPTERDDVDEPNGDITVTLLPGDGYTLSDDDRDRLTATADIRDDDEPPPATAASFAAAASSAAEGDGTRNVRVSLSPPPRSGITLTYAVTGTATEGADFSIAGSGSVSVSANAGSADIPVAIADDADGEGDETVVLTLADGPGHDLGVTRIHTLTITDDDGPPPATPSVSIARGADVTEGGDATFTLTASPAPAAGITVNVNVADSGDFAADGQAGARTVAIGAGGTATLAVRTVNDSADEPDGDITATVGDGSDYDVGDPPSATVAVTDDDAAPPPATPSVSIARGADVTEGGTATFTLTASPAPAAGITVNVNVADSGDFAADGQAGARTVAIGAGGTATLAVRTVNDSADEPDGGITATVGDGSDYDVGDPPSATVAVTDDDAAPPPATPSVSIARGADVTEGGTATFTLTASPAPAAGITVNVNVNVAQDGDFAADGQAGARTVTIGAGGTATLAVATVDDDADEPDGGVTVTVNDGSGYAVGSPAAAAVAVTDDDAAPPPATPSVSIARGADVTEGGTATFTLTASPAPAAGITVNVNVNVAQDGDFAADGQAGARTVTIGAGGTATLAVATVDDDADEPDGGVTVTVNDGSGYAVGSPAAAAVAVTDDDAAPPPATPSVSIARGADVTEGGDATFTLTASPAPAAGITVNVNVADSGDFAADGQAGARTVAIGAGGTATLAVRTVNDSADEPDGDITATVGDGSDYDVGDPPSATVAVTDDDAAPPPATPSVSIARGADVTEGGDATFTLTASPAPAAGITVNVNVADSGDFAADGQAGARTVAIGAGGTATLAVRTVNDSADEPDGDITATVGDGSDYDVGDPPSATVAVTDDDAAPPPATPSVSIARGADVTEGGTATFTLTASPAPAAGITVNVNVADSGDFAADGQAGARTVAIGAGGTATLAVRTVNDSADEPDGGITATVGDGSDYDVGDPPSATVAVTDDDAAPPPATPSVSIARGADVTEGGTATFTLTASPAPAAGITVNVNVNVAQDGDFAADGQAGARTVTIGAGGTATLAVATVDDAADEPDGGVTVTVNDGSGYAVGSPAAAAVAVTDDDAAPPPATPSVSIARGADVTEGGTATFTLTASPAPAAGITVNVNVNVAQDGDFAADGQAGARTVTIGAGGTATLAVATVDDDADEPDGGVTVTVNDGSGYAVGSPAAAAVAVTDDDAAPPPATPSVSIARGADVTEGGDATFTLTASPAPAAGITVNVNVADSGDFAADGQAGARTVAIGAGGTATLAVRTVNDSADEPDGDITATVGDGSDYDVGDPPSATVAVTDDDAAPPPATPSVSIARGADVTEGGTATFTLTASPAPAAGITVNVNVADSGDFAADGQAGARTVAIGAGGTATLAVRTVNDSADEPDGDITATVGDGSDYDVGDPPSATVAVTDDDAAPPPATPSVSIARGADVTEGGTATFTLTASPAPAAGITVNVNVNVAQDGDFAADGQAGARTVTIGAGGTATLAVATVDDAADEPDGGVTVTVNDGSGYAVGSPAAAAVAVADDDAAPTAVALSLDPGTVAEGGGPAEVAVTARIQGESRFPGDRTLTITVGADGDAARPGEDYEAVPAFELTIPAGARGGSARFTLSPVDDGRHEPGGESVTVSGRLDGAEVAPAALALADDDAGPESEAWLGRFGRAAAEEIVEGVSDRLAAPRREGAEADAGPLLQLLATAGGGGPWVPRSLGEGLAGASFSLTGRDGRWALWGRGSHLAFNGASGGGAVDGGVASAMAGADWSSSGLLLGLLVSHSDGSGDHRRGGRSGSLSSSLTAVTPYVGWQVSDRVSLWGLAGAGWGRLRATAQGARRAADADLSTRLAAVGGRGELRAAGGFALALKGDALAVGVEATGDGLDADAGSSRLRLGLEASWRRPAAGGDLTSRLEAGLRRDAGDADRGLGAEAAGGLAWAGGPLRLDLEARGLLAHDDDGFEQFGVSAASALWDPSPNSPRGPSLSLRRGWGLATQNGIDALLGNGDALGAGAMPPAGAPAGAGDGPGTAAEAGWGLPAFGADATPHLLYRQTTAARSLGVGWRMAAERPNGRSLILDLEWTRAWARNGFGHARDPGHGATLSLRMAW